MERAKVDYPCDWTYKIIGSDRALIEKAVPGALGNICFKFCESNQSKTGKYISFNLSVRVDSEAKRDEIFNILKNIPAVKIIL